MDYNFIPFWKFTSQRKIEKFRVVKQHHPRSEYLHFLADGSSNTADEVIKQYAWIEDIFNYLYFFRVNIKKPNPNDENFFSKKAITFLLRHIPESVKVMTSQSLTISTIFTRILVAYVKDGNSYLKKLLRLESQLDVINWLEEEKKELEKNLKDRKNKLRENENTMDEKSKLNEQKEIEEIQRKLEEIKKEIREEKNKIEIETNELVNQAVKFFEQVVSEYFKVVALGFTPDGFSDPFNISARKVEELLQIARALSQQIRDIVVNIKTNSLWEGSTIPDIKELDDEVMDIVEILQLKGKTIFPESFVASPKLKPKYKLIVDTSGSMRGKIPGWEIHKIEIARILSQALVDNDIVEEIWHFDDVVERISLQELKTYPVGGGTNIDAVFRITQTPSIVITDGEWELSAKDNPNLWIFAFDPYQIEVKDNSTSIWRRVYEINIDHKIIAPVKK